MSRVAFLFDLDGVLIDSEREYTRIWHEVDRLWPTGVPGFEHVIKGTTLQDILQTYFSTDEIRRRVMQYCIDREREMEFRMCEGADELLTQLHERGIPAVVVTSSDGAKMQRLYERMPDFRQKFHAIVDGDMVTRSKPDPEGYLMAAALAGCDPADCVVVEDSLTGIRAGHNAGAFVIGITGTFPREAIEREKPDLLLDSLTEYKFNA